MSGYPRPLIGTATQPRVTYSLDSQRLLSQDLVRPTKSDGIDHGG